MKLKHDFKVDRTLSKYITKTVLHTCIICQKKILNERNFLDSHLNGAHNTTVNKYVEDYKLTYVKKPTDVGTQEKHTCR